VIALHLGPLCWGKSKEVFIILRCFRHKRKIPSGSIISAATVVNILEQRIPLWFTSDQALQVIAHGQDFVGQDTWVPTSREAALYHGAAGGPAIDDPSGVICEDTKDIVNIHSKQLEPGFNASGLVVRTNSIKANGLVARTPRAAGQTVDPGLSQGLSIFIEEDDKSPRQPTPPVQE
jgi:hypothetical protein